MSWLLDTDICIYVLRGHPTVRAHFEEQTRNGIAVSVITLAELRYGAACSTRVEENQRVISNWLESVAVLDVTPAVAQVYADSKAALRKQGNLIEDFDLLIGATAITHDLTLITNNFSHFERIPRIMLDRWL